MASDQQPLIIGLTFSQAQGLEPLPQPLALGEVSAHFRVDIWNWLYRQIAAHSYAEAALPSLGMGYSWPYIWTSIILRWMITTRILSSSLVYTNTTSCHFCLLTSYST